MVENDKSIFYLGKFIEKILNFSINYFCIIKFTDDS